MVRSQVLRNEVSDWALGGGWEVLEGLGGWEDIFGGRELGGGGPGVKVGTGLVCLLVVTMVGLRVGEKIQNKRVERQVGVGRWKLKLYGVCRWM